MKKLLTGFVLSLAFAFPAFAGMIETPPRNPQQTQRERVLQLMERPDVAEQLEKMGISAGAGEGSRAGDERRGSARWSRARSTRCPPAARSATRTSCYPDHHPARRVILIISL